MKRIKLISKHNISFVLVFVIIFFSVIRESMIRYTIVIRPMYTLLPAVFIVLLSITRSNCKEYICEYLLFAFGFVMYSSSGADTIIILSSMMIVCKQYDYKSFVKTTFYSILISMIIVCSLSGAGVLREIHFYRLGTNEARSSFGFVHPNLFALFLCALNFSLAAYKGKDYDFKHLIIMIISLYIVYRYPKSYTVAIVMLLFAILFALLKMKILIAFFMNAKWIFKTIIILGIPLLIIMIYRISTTNNSLEILIKLGITANSRLTIAHEALSKYGITLFGQHVDTYGTIYFIMKPYATESYFNIDCLYIKMLVQHGLVAFTIFWGSVIKSLKAYVQSNDPLLLCMGLVLVIYSIMETGLSNPALFFVVVGWSGTNQYKQNQNMKTERVFRRILFLHSRRGIIR